jgi:hypothetical protein
MARSIFSCWRDRHPLLIALTLGASLVGSCAEVPDIVLRPEAITTDTNNIALGEAIVDTAKRSLAPAVIDLPQQGGSIERPMNNTAQPIPQLVRQASLTLVLTNIDVAVTQVQTLLQQVQGDMLGLQDHRSPTDMAQHVTLTLRVPQAKLDTVLTALRSLGTVQQQTLTVEDVSIQIVDLDARLKNLRQSEAALLKIMERSGEISHVLEVASELSTTREAIERIAAHQQNLQHQITYAQIDLTLHSPVAPVPPLRPVGETLHNTWETATQSVKSFTIRGLKLGLWLMAFSPYWALLTAAGYGGYRLWYSRLAPATVTETDRN